MRMSCNGCRVLRKGCGDNCSIRPCLQWIKSPASQAHATVFLAKFYGRAGLMNLINAGPEPLRPAIFRSLLYEACGRILNPIYGSVGLLWDGSWQLCHAATEAVLSGMPITPIASASEAVAPPLNAYDIRHVPREENPAAAAMMAAAAGEVNGARPIRSGRFKRPGARTKAHPQPPAAATVECCNEESNKSPSHESSLSHQSELGAENAEEGGGGGDSKETESNSMVSAETTTTVAKPSQPVKAEPEPEPESEVGLELTLGVKPVSRESRVIPVKKRRLEQRDGACRMELGLLT